MALRELALRRTADRVENDVQEYRVERSIGRVWKTEAAVLCCIGPRDSGEHVVRSAALLAQQLAVSWHAVYVETPALQRLQKPPARAHPARRQARRGSRRDDGGAAEQRGGRGRGRARAPAQPVEDRHGASPGELLAAGRDACAAGRQARAGRRSDRDRRIGCKAPRRAGRTRRRAARPWVPARGVSRRRRRLRAAHRDRAAARGRARRRQHRHAVPARSRRRGAALRPRAGGAGVVDQRARVRLLLRSTAPVVQRLRRPVRPHLRRHARGRARSSAR